VHDNIQLIEFTNGLGHNELAGLQELQHMKMSAIM
jgi:hypothetical protein